jgi:ABC-type Fe3+/spermidine/putrescine transport system ATPase subunit
LNEPAASIEIRNLVVDYGEVRAVNDVSLTVGRGELVTLLGPSGCGKTTTLRAVAGLEDPTGGSIRLNGVAVYSAADRRNTPAEKRGVSMVFQSYAIWPHMTVFENVAYGLRVRKMPAAEIASNVARVLDLVQMRDYADRPSSKLSGGQQQRVAVARAIAFSPEVLLFDEPLSNLDAKLRVTMRVELRELQKRLGITALYVTHDQEEALAISDRVIVMNAGRIEQIGTPEEIYRHPRTLFVADFVGNANVIQGRSQGAPAADGAVVFTTEDGTTLRAIAADSARVSGTAVVLQAAYVDLFAGSRADVPNATPGKIHRRMFHGDFIQYVVDWPCGQLIVRRPPTDLFEEDSIVTISFAPEHCVLL